MLHTQTAEGSTLELLRSLQQKDYLNGFYLVGGTALAFYYRHRKSIDIDLFTSQPFDVTWLLEQLQQDYLVHLYHTAPGTIKGNINKVNVDLITHRYPYLDKPFIFDGYKLLSEKDIIAMKLNAISVSGQRSKDYIDIFFALENHSIASILSYYQKKYKQEGDMHILKSLVYFNDVDLSDWPVLLKNPDLKWKEVKVRLEKEVLAYAKKNKLNL